MYVTFIATLKKQKLDHNDLKKTEDCDIFLQTSSFTGIQLFCLLFTRFACYLLVFVCKNPQFCKFPANFASIMFVHRSIIQSFFFKNSKLFMIFYAQRKESKPTVHAKFMKKVVV